MHPVNLKLIMNIGARVKEILFQKGYSAKWLADQIDCERTNVYDIFKREDMSVGLLQRISVILKHDFLRELSEESFGKEKI